MNKTQPADVRETPIQPGQGPCHQACTTVWASLAAEKLEALGSEGSAQDHRLENCRAW